jgi:hypothetical protein
VVRPRSVVAQDLRRLGPDEQRSVVTQPRRPGAAPSRAGARARPRRGTAVARPAAPLRATPGRTSSADRARTRPGTRRRSTPKPKTSPAPATTRVPHRRRLLRRRDRGTRPPRATGGAATGIAALARSSPRVSRPSPLMARDAAASP